MPRKRLKQERMPETYNLHQIEAWASMVGNEVHYDTSRITVTRKIAEYVPWPQAGAQGQWRETYRDDLVEAALWAAKINGITASMFRALQSIDDGDRDHGLGHGGYRKDGIARHRGLGCGVPVSQRLEVGELTFPGDSHHRARQALSRSPL